MDVTVCECPKPLCRYRWIPRVLNPKECPECKYRFGTSLELKLDCKVVKVRSREELGKLKKAIKQWNDKDRFNV